MITVFVDVNAIVSVGAPGAGTIESKLQNPLVREKLLPVIVPPASG